MLKNIIITLLLLCSFSIMVSAQSAGGQIRRAVKKPQTTNVTPRKPKTTNKRPTSKVQKMSESQRKSIIQNLINNMVYVEGGSLMMGATPEQGQDEYDFALPAYKGTVNSFYICRYELTQDVWKAVFGRLPEYYHSDELHNSNVVGRNKAVEVNWKDAIRFIEKLNTITGMKFRMPTETEWEYAARGGVKSKGYKYSGSNNINDVAWYHDNNDIKEKSFVIGLKHPNELGLYDMSGNVSEWCSDKNLKRNSKREEWKELNDNYRIRKGGCWCSTEIGCKVSSRDFQGIQDYCNTWCLHGTGLRLVCDRL